MNIIAFNHILFKTLLYDQVWKFDIKNIYPKYQTLYRYRSNYWLRISENFLVNKIDREDSEKNSFLVKIEATKCVLRSYNLWKLFKELNIFVLLRIIVTSLQLLLPVIQTIFFRCCDFQSAENKFAKIKCLLFRPTPQKFHTAEITGYTVVSYLCPFSFGHCNVCPSPIFCFNLPIWYCQTFPITGLLTSVTWWVLLVVQELSTLVEHRSSLLV